jgi:hypothetical protein
LKYDEVGGLAFKNPFVQVEGSIFLFGEISPQKKHWRRMIGARSNPENHIYCGAHASPFTSLSKEKTKLSSPLDRISYSFQCEGW